MSGRAGRRGIDDKGITILMVDQKLEPDVAQGMLKGQSLPLDSSFKVGYNMLLNSLRMEDKNTEYIIKRSFYQFQSKQKLPAKRKKLAELQKSLDSFTLGDERQLRKLYKSRTLLKELQKKIQDIVLTPKYLLPYLCIGRLVYVKSPKEDWGWGIIINFLKKSYNKRYRGKGKFQRGSSCKIPTKVMFMFCPLAQVYLMDTMIYMKNERDSFTGELKQ